jgi:hypothetical protein
MDSTPRSVWHQRPAPLTWAKELAATWERTEPVIIPSGALLPSSQLEEPQTFLLEEPQTFLPEEPQTFLLEELQTFLLEEPQTFLPEEPQTSQLEELQTLLLQARAVASPSSVSALVAVWHQRLAPPTWVKRQLAATWRATSRAGLLVEAMLPSGAVPPPSQLEEPQTLLQVSFAGDMGPVGVES